MERLAGFGMRLHPILNRMHMHTGMDWKAPLGAPVLSAGDGVVQFAGRRGQYGLVVEIDHGQGVHTMYAHLRQVASGLKAGQRVSRGSEIGAVGTTGLSAGPHLHFEIAVNGKPVDPAKYPVLVDK